MSATATSSCASLFDAEEIALLREAIETDPRAAQQSLRPQRRGGQCDADGDRGTIPATASTAWPRARSASSTRWSRLLGGEVYHYHPKLIAKEPHVGGAWEWHQDYGYWYNNGCLFPLMASCLIALDPATRENGCLQVLKGSHLHAAASTTA